MIQQPSYGEGAICKLVSLLLNGRDFYLEAAQASHPAVRLTMPMLLDGFWFTPIIPLDARELAPSHSMAAPWQGSLECIQQHRHVQVKAVSPRSCFLKSAP